MKKSITILLLAFFVGSIAVSSCTRASKSCKSNQKKVKQMRKSGQINM